MLLKVYQLLWRVAPWWIQRYLRKRGRMAPAYLKHWDERFGKPIPNPVQKPIWIHAVSVGETRAAAPLIAQLQHYLPDTPLLLTQMTPTGKDTAQQLYPNIQCRYLPYDRPEYVAQFLAEHQPVCGILMETELWPNLIMACHERHIPLFLANARLSAKSLQGYLKAGSLFKPVVAQLTAIFAQTDGDATRLALLGGQNITVCGNTKYDIEPPPQALSLAQVFRQRFGQRAVVVCGSTRVDKEDVDEAQLLLEAWKILPNDALLVIVPRHPERFEQVYQTALSLGFEVQKRSDNEVVRPVTHVWIGDSMGELFAYYQCADVVFVGGSLVDTGCQNVIEPIACAKPTVFGFSTYNFEQACAAALADGVAKQVMDVQQWQKVVLDLLENPNERAQMQASAHQFIAKHQGASQKMAAQIVAQASLLNHPLSV